MTSEELTRLLDLYAREKAAADATGVVNGHWIAIEAVADAVRQAGVAVVERVEREALARLAHAREHSTDMGIQDAHGKIEGVRTCLAALKDGAK